MEIQPSSKDEIKIILLEGIHESAVEIFLKHGFSQVECISNALQGEDLVKKLEGSHIVGVRSRSYLTKDVLQAVSSLMVIGCFCIGTNQVDLSAAALRGVPVFNAPHSNTRSVAELVIGLSVMLLRDIFSKSSAAHRGIWLKSAKDSFEIRSKKIGIVGYGRIGSQVSILAESLGMQVLYYDIQSKLPLGNARQVDRLDELLSQCDIVTLHIPETPKVRHLFNKTVLGKMKEGAYLINASRGVLVDLEALKECLEAGHLKGAAIDVFPEEPSQSGGSFKNLLCGMDNVILTPHIGGSTQEAQYNIGLEVSRKLVRYIEYGNTESSVNFPALSLPPHKDTHRICHIHHNVPGMLQQINTALSEEKINVNSQYLLTSGKIGYVVLDIEKNVSERLFNVLQTIEGTICTRVLY